MSKKNRANFAVFSTLIILSVLFTGCSLLKKTTDKNIEPKSISDASNSVLKGDSTSTASADNKDSSNNSAINSSVPSSPTPSAPAATAAAQEQKSQVSVPSSTPKPTTTPMPVPVSTPKPVQNSNTSPVNQVVAKPADIQPSSVPAVQVSDTDAFNTLVVTNLLQGKDVSVTLNNSITKDTVADKALKAAEDAGYSGYISGIEYSTTSTTATLRFQYKGGKEHFLADISAVNTKVQEIINSVIKAGMSDYSKEIALHDYLINHANYDEKNLESNTIPDDSYTAYGALIKGTAVCQGYAEAMYRLLNKAGVKTLIITGDAISDGGKKTPHAWNLVSIGGAYYHLDATFDDPVLASGGSTLSYEYFNITDSQVSKDHTWLTASYPKCTSTAANYFVMNNLIANNKTDFYNVIKNGLINKQTVIQCKTASYDTSVYTPGIIYDIVRDNPGINYLNLGNGYSYSYDQSCVFEFYVSYK